MNIEIVPRHVPISHIANGDIVELEGRICMLCDKHPAKHAELVVLAFAPVHELRGPRVGDRFEVTPGTLVLHHPHAKLVIP